MIMYMWVDLQTILGFWKKQTRPKSLKMKFKNSVDDIPQDLLPHIQEITLKGWYEFYTVN